MTKLENVNILNDGNPMELGTCENGHLFTVSPSTAKKNRGYYTDRVVGLTKYELRMPGVVIAQNRGMIFSSCRKIVGDYVIPELKDMNLIIVDEVSRKLHPIDDDDNKIAWKGAGEHVIKDVIADGQGQHWFCHTNGSMADDLWMKIAGLGYGLKGMIQPGLASDVNSKVTDHWGVERTITMGNTMLINSSVVKGLGAYDSLEDLVAHGEEWGLTKMMKQWQSGDHKPQNKRIMGTQPNATNLQQEKSEIMSLLRPEALKIWAMRFQKVAWMENANINTARGRALAARPNLMYKDLVMHQIDTKAGNNFLRLAQGKFMAEARYLKMYMDKLVYSLVYVHGMDPNEAAKKAAQTGLHGEIRVNPSFAGLYYEDGAPKYRKEVGMDNKGLFIVIVLVRYPHGAASETIIVKAYLDATVPEDVIIFPAPVADDEGNVPVATLYAFRLQGADFDGDAVTAFTERIWIESQKRNTGKSYMIIPVNTEGTEKDKTLVTDETWESFCMQKVASLTNQVGLIATSLKYFMSQEADRIREEDQYDIGIIQQMIVDHACAMGDDIDEFKHGKANNTLVPFMVSWLDKEEYLTKPYFTRYAKKYRSEDDFNKAVFNKDGSERTPGTGSLDMYAVVMEQLMAKSGLPIVSEVAQASDGTNRWFKTVHPVTWQAKDVDLYISEHGEGQSSVALPEELEKVYGIEHGTKFSAKDLFQLLYRDHSATCKDLLSIDGDDRNVKTLIKINERYALAKIAVVAWTKKMEQIRGREINAEEAMKIFTTLMTQHTESNRSIIDMLTRYGSFKKADKSTYEKTIFMAQRCFNYFLDLCGDGLLLIGTEKPDFPEVSEKVLSETTAKEPDLEKAKELALKEIELIDNLVNKLSLGIDAVLEEVDDGYVPEDPGENDGYWEGFEDGFVPEDMTFA